MASASATSSSSVSHPPSPNTSHFIKLTETNYLVWLRQIKPYLHGNKLWGYVDGSIPAPPTTILSTPSKPPTASPDAPDATTPVQGIPPLPIRIPNPAYEQWFVDDQLTVSILTTTLTEPIASLTIGFDTAKEIWDCLARHFSQKSVASAASLKMQLLDLQKGNQTIDEYLRHAKSIADALTAINKPVSDEDLVVATLHGLGPDYLMLRTALTQNPPLPDFTELRARILAFDSQFVRRKEFYKKVGKAWKRGYLLYGPPGTGKSSLIAAMANYLKFSIFDLELSSISTNCELRKALLSTSNRSILVIEDIDCSVEIQNREAGEGASKNNKSKKMLTLSGLLNFIDGLWSSCGDERIIVFTTNHKDRLDPALLRPGRMDMNIYMSYCTAGAFSILASNYLGIHCRNRHRLYGEIEGLIEGSEVTPAEVAEELLKIDDAEVALEGLLSLLKRKKVERDQAVEGSNEVEIQEEAEK